MPCENPCGSCVSCLEEAVGNLKGEVASVSDRLNKKMELLNSALSLLGEWTESFRAGTPTNTGELYARTLSFVSVAV